MNQKLKSAVIKIGGQAAEAGALKRLAGEMKTLLNDFQFIVVHGGGAEVSRVSEIFGYRPVFSGGIRITSTPEMAVADMVLSGRMNKDITRIFRLGGLNALGLSGSDGGLFTGLPLSPDTRTGRITRVRPELIRLLLNSGYLPVVGSTSMEEAPGGEEAALNINADEAALALAESLGAEDLIFISDIPGILNAKKEVIPSLSQTSGEEQIALGTISGGMIPKVRSCFKALEGGVRRVIIGEYRNSGDLEALLRGDRGTRLVKASLPAEKAPPLAWAFSPPLAKYFGPDFLILDHGEGVYLWDGAGKKYLDFASGIGVNALGYGLDEWARAAADQFRRLPHSSNLFISQPVLELAYRLCSAGGFDAVQFGNSGSEANEAAIKSARLYSLRTKGPGHHKLLCFTRAFHGRTLGALSLTPTEKYQTPFAPLLGDVTVLPYNDGEALRRTAGETYAAILVEPIQGEGGLDTASPDFVQALNEVCYQHNIILIADEVQCGLGRTGEFFASALLGLKPDIVTLAKPLAAGLPLSAALIPEKINALIHPGEHGTTFGGNPVACALACRVLDTIFTPEFLDRVKERGQFFQEGLKKLAGDFPRAGEIRGAGLMLGLEIEEAPEEGGSLVPKIISAAQEAGLLLLRSGVNVLRFLPPLTIGEDEITQGLEILHSVFHDLHFDSKEQ
ncbi:MAG: acetylglutamate kinase [Spirochaetales bacterium]|jgi:acetylornithine/N-succinyldiaminopimelate aminotransferase|nr:acetylglutamate kinase [Spirochaetales bacterium]